MLKKRVLKAAVITLIVWAGIMGAMALIASAQSVNVDLAAFTVEHVTVTGETTGTGGNEGTISAQGNVITVSAKATESKGTCGTEYTATTTTLRVTAQTNIETIEYTASGLTADAGNVPSGSSLSEGASLTFTVSSGKDANTVSGTLTISGITLPVVEYTTTFETASGGSYTVTFNGESVSVPGTHTAANSSPYVLTASPDAGNLFAGWSVDGRAVSTASPYNYTATSNATVRPIFAPSDSAMYQVSGIQYSFLDQAIEAAGADGTITVVKGGTVHASDGVTTSFTIPSGVTFIVPYAAAYNYNSIAEHPYACETQTTSTGGTLSAVAANAFLELKVPTGVEIRVEGVMAVGGTTNGVCLITGAHANVKLESGAGIVVERGGRLSSCGFIYGDGSVTAENGSTVYMPFSVLDFRGGGYTVGVAAKASGQSMGLSNFPSGEAGVSPFNRYCMAAIQAALTLKPGSVLIGYLDLYASSAHNCSNAQVIAPSEGIIVTKASTTVEISYNAAKVISNVGRTHIKISGDAEFGELSMTVSLSIVTASIKTSSLTFPVPFNYDIEIAEGTFTAPHALMLLPGARVTVDEGAVLNVNDSLTVYDGLHDYTVIAEKTNMVLTAYADRKSGYSTGNPSNPYPTTDQLKTFGGSGMAELVVKGTMNLNTAGFGGIVQTDGSASARIVVGAVTEPIQTATEIGGTGTYTVLTKKYAFAGATVRTLQGQIYDPTTGQLLPLKPGMTYSGAAGENEKPSYAYDLYYSSDTDHETLTESAPIAVQGAWYNYAVTVSTMLNGSAADTATKYFAHGANVTDMGFYLNEECTEPATEVVNSDPLYVPLTITLSFDPNGGTGDITTYSDVDLAVGSTALPWVASVEWPNPDQMTFLGWSTVQGASEADFTEESYTVSEFVEKLHELGKTPANGETVTLYAVWRSNASMTCEITLSDMSFTYTAPEYRWDPENIQYVCTNPEEAGWRADAAGNTITVAVEGGDGSVALSFAPEAGIDGLGMDFTRESGEGFLITKGSSASFRAMLTGTPTGPLENTPVGKITVTVGPA